MISYIFKSKPKNILVAIFSLAFLCLNLKELCFYALINAWGYMALKLIELIPYILIFVYMITLKRDYKFKQFLFPIAFSIGILLTVFSLKNCFNLYSLTSTFLLFDAYINFAIRIIMLVGYIFCFVGTISNFERVVFLRSGLIICAITTLILGSKYYTFNGFISAQLPTYSYLIQLLMEITILLFYISIFILTLTKKSEYIDITPFVEERKIKKATKKAKKLEREKTEEFSPPNVPDGYWRCMGCGEILPDDKDKCKCGYKR